MMLNYEYDYSFKEKHKKLKYSQDSIKDATDDRSQTLTEQKR